MRGGLAPDGSARVSPALDGPAGAPRLIERRTGRYQPPLDGLRALAVVGAMLFHANALRGGFLGVDLFFVLSGYLITGLLINEAWATGTIDMARFYTRRFRRLAPALALVLVVTLVWAYRFAPPAVAPAAAKQVGWSVAYLNNWYALFGKVGYWGAGTTTLPLNHLWSLAIEEQFYLVWPVVIVFLVRAGLRLRRLRLVIAGLAAASGAWQWIVADRFGVNRAYLGTDTRFTALAIGATIAVLFKEVSERPIQVGSPRASNAGTRRTAGRWNLAVLGSVTFLGFSWVVADLSKVSLYHGWLLACSAAAGLLIAAVVANPASWFAVLLSLRPLVWIGKRSYSLYLWHWPIWVMFNGSTMGDSGADLWTVRIFLTVVVSALSYKYVEQPIRNSSLSGRKMVAAMAPLAAGIGVLVIAVPPVLPVSLGNRPVLLGSPPSPSGAIAVNGSPTPAGSLRILVTGDSWGRNMGYALSLADKTKRDTIIDLGIPGCGLLTAQSKGCSNQFQSWAHTEATNSPDVALLVEGTYDQGAAEQAGGVGAVCAPGYQQQYQQALDTAISTLHGTANLPVFLTTDRQTLTGDPASTTCMNNMLTAAAKRDRATLFDLGGLLCPSGRCVTEHDGAAVYDDTEHLAPAGQQWVGGLVLEAINSRVKPAPAGAVRSATGPCQSMTATRAVPVASYQANPEAPYLDSADHTKLTDGVLGKATFLDPAWMGWQTTTTDIVEDLARPAKVCSATSDWLQVLGGAVVVPPTIDVYVSNVAGRLGQLLGSVQAPQLDGSDQTATMTVNSPRPIFGRYVTLRVNTFGSWSMVDEVGVRVLP
jgi:peptidoglycan/LPS O-acetylase OafA/YrhL